MIKEVFIYVIKKNLKEKRHLKKLIIKTIDKRGTSD